MTAAHTEPNDLIKAPENAGKEAYIRNLKSGLRCLARKNLDAILDTHNTNVIIAPRTLPFRYTPLQQSRAPTYWTILTNQSKRESNATGYPVAAAPLGQLRYNRRPFGLCLLARQCEEQTLLRFMSAYQDVVRAPGAPPLQFSFDLPSLGGHG